MKRMIGEWSMLEDLSLLQLVIQNVSNPEFEISPDIWRLIGDKMQLSTADCQRRYTFLLNMFRDHKQDNNSSIDNPMKSSDDSYLSRNEKSDDNISSNSLCQIWQESSSFELLLDMPHQNGQQSYDATTIFEDRYHDQDSDMTPLDSIFCQPDNIFSQ